MNNISKFYIKSAIWQITTMIISAGSILQSFLAESGFSEERTALVISVMQFFQTAFILICSPVADKIKNVIRTTALSLLFCLPFLGFLFVNCFLKSSGNSVFTIIILLSVISQFGAGLYTILSYKLPYHIMDMNNYGTHTSASGAIGCLVNLGFSLVLSFAQAEYNYFSVMKWAFLITAIFIVVFVFVTGSMKRIPFSKPETPEKINIFKYPPFYKLILPNLFRGFCSGAVAMAVTIGYYYDILNAFTSSVLVVITNAVSVLGYAIFSFCEKRFGLKWSIIIPSALLMLAMPMMVATKSAAVFLSFYGVAYLALIIIGVAVPVAVVKLIDYKVSGQYNGYRMMLHTLGITIFTSFCISMLKTFGGILTMLFAAILQLVSGIVYFICLKQAENK